MCLMSAILIGVVEVLMMLLNIFHYFIDVRAPLDEDLWPPEVSKKQDGLTRSEVRP